MSGTTGCCSVTGDQWAYILVDYNVWIRSCTEARWLTVFHSQVVVVCGHRIFVLDSEVRGWFVPPPQTGALWTTVPHCYIPHWGFFSLSLITISDWNVTTTSCGDTLDCPFLTRWEAGFDPYCSTTVYCVCVCVCWCNHTYVDSVEIL